MSRRLLSICICSLTILIFSISLSRGEPAPLPPHETIFGLAEQVSPDSLFENVSRLVSFHTRHTYSDTLSATNGIGAARNWMRERFMENGAESDYFPWNGYWGGWQYDCYNINGILEGSAGRDDLIILGGHIDSRGASSSDTSVFAPGADDDASGVAAQLEISRLLSGEEILNTVSLNAFTGEEQGLLGATAYAQSMQTTATGVIGMLNMDMIGHIVHPAGGIDSSTIRLYSGGPQEGPSRRLARYVKWVGEAYSGGLTVNMIDALDRPGRSGDHVPFYNMGYPAVRIIETAEDVAYQHGPNDLPENMSFSYARKAARLVFGVTAVLSLADNVELPAPAVLNAGDGESLLIAWPDSISPPPGGEMLIAFRQADELYWEDVIFTTAPSPYQLSGLDEGIEYAVSISYTTEESLPLKFGPENFGTPAGAVPPENFETTSTAAGIELKWSPRPEPNTLEYVIERAVYGEIFEEIEVVSHPDSVWFDSGLSIGQLYYYQVRTRITGMFTGDPGEPEEGQLASHHLGILIVDGTPDGTGPPGSPVDEEVDQFYESILEGFEIAAQWDRADSLREEITISDADFAAYSLVICHMDAINGSVADDTTAIRKYIENGGKFMLCGWRLSRVVSGLTGYELGFSEGDFLYDLAGIDSIRVATATGDGLIGAAGLAGYPAVDFDELTFPYWGGVIPLSDGIWTESFPAEVSVISTYIPNGGTASDYYGKAVGLRGGSDPADWIILDFPLYYFHAVEAAAFMAAAMSDLEAPLSSIESCGIEAIPGDFRMFPARPNPFNSQTVISFRISSGGRVDLDLYDVRGRLVSSLFEGDFTAGTHSISINGEGLASGIYFTVIRYREESAAAKILLLK